MADQEKPKKEKAKPKGGSEAKAKTKAEAKAKAEAKPAVPMAPPRLWDFYRQECIPKMMQEFRYRSPMQVPRLEKIVINIGLGEAIQNIKLLESASQELSAIAGQKPVVTR